MGFVCELCGGASLKKENGMFVCENCGTKYSIEEAKNLLGQVNLPESINKQKVMVVNQAQFDNLVKLAYSALKNDNFEEAEKQANLALAINSTDYYIMLIKAEAIAGQTSAQKSRIAEAFDCFMEAWSLAPLNEENSLIDVFDESIYDMLCQEVGFWVAQIEEGRPTEGSVRNAKYVYEVVQQHCDSYLQRCNSRYMKLKGELRNYFIYCVNEVCKSAWQSTVAYNYYRDSLSDYGRHWRINGRDYSSDYRPSEDIWNTFSNEVYQMNEIMLYAIDLSDSSTSYQTLAELYSQMAFNQTKLKDSVCFTRWTYQDNYGGYEEYWEVGKTWKTETMQQWQKWIAKMQAKANEYEKLEKNRIQKQRNDEFWSKHLEEKKSLENELEILKKRVPPLQAKISAIEDDPLFKVYKEDLITLNEEKQNVGIFKIKERKEIQEQIDAITSKKNQLESEIYKMTQPYRAELDSIERKIASIQNELTRNR